MTARAPEAPGDAPRLHRHHHHRNANHESWTRGSTAEQPLIVLRVARTRRSRDRQTPARQPVLCPGSPSDRRRPHAQRPGSPLDRRRLIIRPGATDRRPRKTDQQTTLAPPRTKSSTTRPRAATAIRPPSRPSESRARSASSRRRRSRRRDGVRPTTTSAGAVTSTDCPLDIKQ